MNTPNASPPRRNEMPQVATYSWAPNRNNEPGDLVWITGLAKILVKRELRLLFVAMQ
jgi:hypothetical protein